MRSFFLTAIAVSLTAVVHAQSLADAAKKAEEERAKGEAGADEAG
jgi:hypothetical protein